MRGLRMFRKADAAARLRAGGGGGGFPGTVQQVGSVAIGNAASFAGPVTVTFPQAATAGNLLVIILAASGSGVRTLTTPSGWTLQGSGSADPTNAGMLWVLTKIAAGGETSQSIAWTGGNMAPGWRGVELTGVDNVTPVLACPVFLVDTSAGATMGITGTSRTTAADNEYQLAVAGGRGPTAGFNSHSFGGGYTESDTTATGGSGVANSAARGGDPAGTVITPTFTFTNAQGSAVTVFGNLSLKAA